MTFVKRSFVDSTKSDPYDSLLQGLRSLRPPEDDPAIRAVVQAKAVLWLHDYKTRLGIDMPAIPPWLAFSPEADRVEQARALLATSPPDPALVAQWKKQRDEDLLRYVEDSGEFEHLLKPGEARAKILEHLARIAAGAGRDDIERRWRKWEGAIPESTAEMDAFFHGDSTGTGTGASGTGTGTGASGTGTGTGASGTGTGGELSQEVVTPVAPPVEIEVFEI